MSRKIVDVFGPAGERLASYAVAFDDADCLDAEFEEAALIFAESSQLMPSEEIVHLRAICEPRELAGDEPVSAVQSERAPRAKGTVVSLVKHRMKKAAASSQAHRLREIS